MLEELRRVVAEMPELLRDPAAWQSLHITYHPPRVERLWRPYGAHRIFLHRIYPCAAQEALWHPHPWPSAVRIVAGRYAHGVSLGLPSSEGPPRRDPRVLLRGVLTAGSEYEMTDRDTWHAVQPLEVVESVMVTGTPYQPAVPMPEAPLQPQQPLAPARVDELLETWARRFEREQGLDGALPPRAAGPKSSSPQPKCER